MSKEVTLRQCRECKKQHPGQNMHYYSRGEGYGEFECIHCELKQTNEQKKLYGDKTEFVLIEKPRDQRLGQVIMNGYRGQWQNLQDPEKIGSLERGGEFVKMKIEEFLKLYEKYEGKQYWDIWEQDTPDIQEKINKLKN